MFKTVIQVPNDMMYTMKQKDSDYHLGWNNAIAAVVRKHPDQDDKMPKWKDLPGKSKSAKLCLGCNMNKKIKMPYFESWTIKKAKRTKHYQHQVWEGLLTFFKKYKWTIAMLTEMFANCIDPNNVPAGCRICGIDYSKSSTKDGYSITSAVNHLNSPFHNFMLAWSCSGFVHISKLQSTRRQLEEGQLSQYRAIREKHVLEQQRKKKSAKGKEEKSSNKKFTKDDSNSDFEGSEKADDDDDDDDNEEEQVESNNSDSSM